MQQIFAFGHLIVFNCAVEKPIMFKDAFILDDMLSVILCNKHWHNQNCFIFAFLHIIPCGCNYICFFL